MVYGKTCTSLQFIAPVSISSTFVEFTRLKFVLKWCAYVWKCACMYSFFNFRLLFFNFRATTTQCNKTKIIFTFVCAKVLCVCAFFPVFVWNERRAFQCNVQILSPVYGNSTNSGEHIAAVAITTKSITQKIYPMRAKRSEIHEAKRRQKTKNNGHKSHICKSSKKHREKVR